MKRNLTRRDFAKAAMLLTAGALAPVSWGTPGAKASPPLNDRTKESRPRYRAVSWWLVWDDLAWPNPELMDKIRRRADQCAASEVNCCVIFGAHFRWDFMPLWDRLHDELHFIADELHQRNILLFDHHSSVLTERPHNRAEALNLWEHNHHHVLFYPSIEEAAHAQFNGSRLNDWRMIDVVTRAPAYVPAYDAEQFCMNHPAFRAAYATYLQKLKTDVPIDGLMSDDNIFYPGWHACACQYCLARFKNEYGRDLPPTSDTNFWGNRRSAAFKDWIAMRFQSSGDFLAGVKDVFPDGFPLLTCCSGSDGCDLPAVGMSYQDFINHCNHVMLEMTGSTPSLTGTWDDRIPSQLLHLGIARDHNAPCFGLGYGFFPDTAFFVWAVNKFLGSDCWFSTLKGRLGATPAELASLADDPELVGEGYRWEKARPQLFTGQPDTDVSVLFSRATRDNFGQVPADYCDDYSASCLALTRAGITCEVVTDIPDFGRTRCLVLSSVVCLSVTDKTALQKFLSNGGTIIATGPTGFYDEHGDPVSQTWLETFNLAVALDDPVRPGGFPPYKNFKASVKIANCRVSEAAQRKSDNGWLKISVGQGELFWRAQRISAKGIAGSVVDQLRARNRLAVQVENLPATWRLRQYRDGHRLLIHALPDKVEVVLHPTLKNHFINAPIVENVKFDPLTLPLILEPPVPLKRVYLHSPDLARSRDGKMIDQKKWSINLEGVSRYFIVEAVV
jgi:hypothetical protein